MKKIIKLTEKDLSVLIKKVINENINILNEEEIISKSKKNKKISPLGKKLINTFQKCETKEEKFSFFESILSERRKIINEDRHLSKLDEGIFDFFTSGIKGGWSTFKEYFFQKLLSGVAKMLGHSGDSKLIKAMSIGMANIDWSQNWKKVFSPVKNCEFFADELADGIIEYYIDEKLDSMFGDTKLGDTLRNAVVDALADQKFVQSIQNLLIDVVCKVVRSIFGDRRSIAPSSSTTPPTPATA